MKNPATASRLSLNDFTQFIKDNPGTKVLLRSGVIVEPIFKEAEDETCEDYFYNKDMEYVWEPNGAAASCSNHDMMEIVK